MRGEVGRALYERGEVRGEGGGRGGGGGAVSAAEIRGVRLGHSISFGLRSNGPRRCVYQMNIARFLWVTGVCGVWCVCVGVCVGVCVCVCVCPHVHG